MSRIDRHRISNKYYDGLDALHGDDGASNALMASNAIAELAKGIGGVVAQEETKKAATRQTEALAQADVDVKKAKAQMADADAKEKDANGPLHKKAQNALDLANAAMAKLAPSSSLSSDSSHGDKHGKSSSSGMPWWAWGLIGVGGIGASVLTYKLLKK